MWQSFVTEQRSLIDELPFLEPALATIAVPTVVVVGTADRMVPPATGRRLAATIPGADLVELEGAGHLLAHQRPRDVAAAVRRLAESGPGAAGRPGAPSSGA
jgi:pimeloyl-ACP methyl ester carboxylesterase